MPDLEDSIRDALRSRSDAVVVHETTLRATPAQNRRRSYAPLLAAAVVLLLALATAAVVTHRGGEEKERTANGGPGFAGYSWRLVLVRDKQGTVRAQAAWNTRLYFTPDGKVGASDTVNALSGRYRAAGDGYVVTDVASTAAGYAGGDPERQRVIAAVTSAFYTADGDTQEPHATVRTSIDGDTLELTTPAAELTYARVGIQGDDPSPSSTSTVSGGEALVGYRWRVTEVQDSKGTLSLPADTSAHFSFPDEKTIKGDDTVYTFSGPMRVTRTGVVPAKIFLSAKAGSGHTTRVSEDIDSLVVLDGIEVTAQVTGTRLVLTLGPTRVTLVREDQIGPVVSS